MALMVGDELRSLSVFVTGDEFPDANEDLLRALAEGWDTAAARLENELRPELRRAVVTIRSSFAGQAEQAFAAVMATLVAGPDNDIATSATFFRQVGSTLRSLALDVEYMKYVVILELEMLKAELAWAAVMSSFLGPVVMVWASARLAMVRRVLQPLIKLLNFRMEELGHLAMWGDVKVAEKAASRWEWLTKGLAVGMPVSLGNQVAVTFGAQALQKIKGTRTEWTNEYFKDAGVVGVVGGLLAPFPHEFGHKLAAAITKLLDRTGRDWHRSFAQRLSHIVAESMHEGTTATFSTAMLTGQFGVSPFDFTAGASSGVARVAGHLWGATITRAALAAEIKLPRPGGKDLRRLMKDLGLSPGGPGGGGAHGSLAEKSLAGAGENGQGPPSEAGDPEHSANSGGPGGNGTGPESAGSGTDRGNGAQHPPAGTPPMDPSSTPPEVTHGPNAGDELAGEQPPDSPRPGGNGSTPHEPSHELPPLGRTEANSPLSGTNDNSNGQGHGGAQNGGVQHNDSKTGVGQGDPDLGGHSGDPGSSSRNGHSNSGVPHGDPNNQDLRRFLMGPAASPPASGAGDTTGAAVASHSIADGRDLAGASGGGGAGLRGGAGSGLREYSGDGSVADDLAVLRGLVTPRTRFADLAFFEDIGLHVPEPGLAGDDGRSGHDVPVEHSDVARPPLRVPDRDQWVAAEIVEGGRPIRFRPGDVISSEIRDGENSIGVSFLRPGVAPFMGAWARRMPVHTVRTLPGESVREAVEKRWPGGQRDALRGKENPPVERSIVLEGEGERGSVTIYLQKGVLLEDGTVLDRDTAIRTDGEGHGLAVLHARAFQELYRRHPDYDLLNAVCFVADGETGQRFASTLERHGVGNKIWSSPDVLTTGQVRFRDHTELNYVGIANNKPWVAFVRGVRQELPDTAYTDDEVRAIQEQEAARHGTTPMAEPVAPLVGGRTGSAAPMSIVDGSQGVEHVWHDHWSAGDERAVALAQRRVDDDREWLDEMVAKRQAEERRVNDARRQLADAERTMKRRVAESLTAEGRVSDAERRAATARRDAEAWTAERRAAERAVRHRPTSNTARHRLAIAQERERDALRLAGDRANEERTARHRLAFAQERERDARRVLQDQREERRVADQELESAQWHVDRAERELREHEARLRELEAAREADRRSAERRSDESSSGSSERITLETTPLLGRYVGENRRPNPESGSGVRYLSREEREAYRIRVVDGRLYDSRGNLFNTRGVRGRGMYVVDRRGRIYASPETDVRGLFQHSSFLAGGRVAAAGEFVVVDGELRFIDDQSGHYEPLQLFTLQFVALLRRWGVSINDDDVFLNAPS